MSDEIAPTRRLTKRLYIAILTPIVLLVAMSVILGAQVLRLAKDASWVDHTDESIGVLNDIERQLGDQESAIRGYVITADADFLDIYQQAHPTDAIALARTLTIDNPPQTARADELKQYYLAWLETASGVIDAAGRGATIDSLRLFRTPDMMRTRKHRADDVRAKAAAMMSEELRLRKLRSEQLAASLEMTRSLFVGLFASAAIVLGVFSRSQFRAITQTYDGALTEERAAREAIVNEEWVRSGQMQLAEALQGELAIEQVGTRALDAIAAHLKADVGAFFTRELNGWKRRAGYSFDEHSERASETFAAGEGLVGRTAEKGELLVLHEVPGDYLRVRSGTGERAPSDVTILPAIVDGRPYAVLELGFLRRLDARSVHFLGRIGEALAIAVRSAESQARLRDLLDESQRQAEELQTQQEELRVANEELAEQGNIVRQAHAQLEERKEELEAINARLEEQTTDLQRAQIIVKEKADEAQRSNQYKSEFLANMSHELRTPLNSSLILAKLLADNKHGNLSPEQVRFAQTIYSAGNDLLLLINDILDLSKIEAGHLDMHASTVPITSLTESLKRTFEPMANEKKVTFAIAVDANVPSEIETDAQRLEQILKNLVSNAIKFTEHGEVRMRVSVDGARIRFTVRDTGVGIAAAHHELVFEAFRQADGAINRKFAGTGLGLSISRELARRLGGEITLASELGKGATFELVMPLVFDPKHEVPRLPEPPRATRPRVIASTPERFAAPNARITDDRDHVERGRRLVLVIEDDLAFARILLDLAHELDFQCIVAHDADSGVSLAREYLPSAILLDINLPDHSGLSVLDRVKRTPSTRHIPVHIASVGDYSKEAMAMGAVGYTLKPVKREELALAFKKIEQRLAKSVRRLLIVEDDNVQRESLGKLLGGPDIETTEVGTVAEALLALSKTSFDCVVTDLALPDASGFDLLTKMGDAGTMNFPPVIVYTGRELSAEEETRLRKYSSSIIVKGARSPERLLDEVTLFLHQVESELPPERQRMLARARDREAVFEGRTVLIVEDDARNIFALSSILEPKGAKVLIARNGKEALAVLDKTTDVDLVLMDIMMPEMDGLEATREIRKRKNLAKLPIIALTAKAMKDDQERCMQAGANDYITKPLDVEMLLSLLRMDAEVKASPNPKNATDIEIRLLLDAIFYRFHYDFRSYSMASLRRRVHASLSRLGCETISALQEKIIHEPKVFDELLQFLTVQVSDMFRDPPYFKAFRELIVPVLRTYPSIKLWVAGCSSGEEAYSLAIILREEGLFDRSLIYATDINPEALKKAEAGVYALDRIATFSENYRLANGKGSLSEYYTAAYRAAVFDRSLRTRIVFSDHSLSTDHVFAEVQVVSCRNVLIYFDRALQDRALGLFKEALCRRGLLGLGAKETLAFSAYAASFEELSREDRWYVRC